MFVRCAYYVGTVPAADQERFNRYVEDVHLPDVATWPRLKRLRLLRNNGEPYEGEEPRYYQCFELSFETQEDMDFCMASEERRRTREQSVVDRAIWKDLFHGEIHHINYEIIDVPLGSA